MHQYKVTFVKNIINSCHEVDEITKNSDLLQYENYNGFLIYALIKAEDETHARKRAGELIAKFLGK